MSDPHHTVRPRPDAASAALERIDGATRLGPARACFAAVGAAGALGRHDVLSAVFAKYLARQLDPVPLYETTLQLFLFCGYPRAIAALDELDRARAHADPGAGAPDRESPPREPELPTGDEVARTWEAGMALAARVYGKNLDRLRARMRQLSPELERWMLLEGYGRVLSRPGLDLAGRECSVVPALAALEAFPQLDSHLRGALASGLGHAELDEALGIAETVASLQAIARARQLLGRLA